MVLTKEELMFIDGGAITLNGTFLSGFAKILDVFDNIGYNLGVAAKSFVKSKYFKKIFR